MPLEIIIRPLLPPQGRPAPVQAPYVPEESEKSVEIAGRKGQVITLTGTESFSFNRSEDSQSETSRMFNITRVFRATTDNDGNITSVDRGQFVDVEHTTGINLRDREGKSRVSLYEPPPAAANVEILQSGVIRRTV